MVGCLGFNIKGFISISFHFNIFLISFEGREPSVYLKLIDYLNIERNVLSEKK